MLQKRQITPAANSVQSPVVKKVIMPKKLLNLEDSAMKLSINEREPEVNKTPSAVDIKSIQSIHSRKSRRSEIAPQLDNSSNLGQKALNTIDVLRKTNQEEIIPANRFEKPVSSKHILRADINNSLDQSETRFRHKSDIKVVNQKDHLVSATDVGLG